VRVIGYIGIAILLLLSMVGVLVGLRRGDWHGVAISLLAIMLFAFFAVVLRQGAKREREPQREKIADSWYGESVTSFFVNCALKSLDGRIFLAGAVLSWLFALLALCCPAAVALDPAKANVVLFTLWPAVSFVWFVLIKGSRGFETNIVSILLILAGTAVPFYLAYF